MTATYAQKSVVMFKLRQFVNGGTDLGNDVITKEGFSSSCRRAEINLWGASRTRLQCFPSQGICHIIVQRFK